MPVFRISILYIQLENLIDILKIRMEINIGGIMVCILAVNNGISYQKETFIFISGYFPICEIIAPCHSSFLFSHHTILKLTFWNWHTHRPFFKIAIFNLDIIWKRIFLALYFLFWTTLVSLVTYTSECQFETEGKQVFKGIQTNFSFCSWAYVEQYSFLSFLACYCNTIVFFIWYNFNKIKHEFVTHIFKFINI